VPTIFHYLHSLIKTIRIKDYSSVNGMFRTSLHKYILVLKPRETILLTCIGLCSAVIAGNGYPDMNRIMPAFTAIMLGSGGANGLTNYIDRHVDSMMIRTRYRVLPAGLIYPAEKALIWSLLLVSISLGLAWYLNPLAFLSGCICVGAAVVARKTWATHFLGSLSSCGPVLVGWLAVNPNITPVLVLLSVVIILWVPIHVWNLMMVFRQDYLKAKVDIFPLKSGNTIATRTSMILCLVLYMVCLAIYSVGDFGVFYLISCNIAGLLLLNANWKMLKDGDTAWAYKIFKLSTYPFLGLIFISLCIDIWIRSIS